MKKQNFPIAYIKRLVSSDRKFNKGNQLATHPESMGEPLAKEKESSIQFTINEDGKKVKTTISFYKNGVAKAYQCTCDDFSSSDGACHHVVASMLRLNEYEADDIPNKPPESVKTGRVINYMHNNNSIALQDLFAYFKSRETSRLNRSNRQALAFEYTVHFKGPKADPSYELEMKAGIDHLYIINDIPETLDHLQKMQNYEFGKRLTYNPKDHFIKEEDQTVLDLLQQLVQVSDWGAKDLPQSAKKTLPIPAPYLKELLSKLQEVEAGFASLNSGRQDPLNQDTEKIPVRVQEDVTKLPLTINVRVQSDNELTLSIEPLDWKQLTFYDRADVIHFDGIFYLLETDVFLAVKKLRDAYDKVGYHPLILSRSQFEMFIASVLPQIRQLIEIDFDDQLQDSMVLAKLEKRLYVDYSGQEFMVRPVFKYQNKKFSPYIQAEEEDIERADATIIVRDFVEEDQALDLLEKNLQGFELREDTWQTTDEVAISTFIYEAMPDLGEEFELFYTKAVENLIYRPKKAPRVLVDINENSRLLDISFELEDVDSDEFNGILQALAQEKSYYKLSDGQLLYLKDGTFDEMRESFDRLGLEENQIEMQMSQPLYKALSLEGLEGLQRTQNFKKFIHDLSEPEDLNFTKPKNLKATLRQYQITGYNWLSALSYYGLGGILADDMGLGKTLQTIAFMAGELERDQDQKFLVLSPSSVLYNWESEIKRFFPSVSVQVIAGNQDEREALLEEALAHGTSIIITSYPLIQRDRRLYQGLNFSALILDEAQNLKNPATKTHGAVQSLKRDKAYALSGTPIENNLGELFSIFSIVQPGLLDQEATEKDADLNHLAKKIRPFVLRRLKSEVLKDLPEKTETTEYIELSSDQKRIYQTQLAILQDDVSKHMQNDTWNQSRMEILAGMTRLRQICNDPRLVLEDYTGESSKFNRLMEYLEEARANGKRVVLFSQFTSMLNLIRQELDARSYDYHYLDGQTPNKERLDLANRFNLGEKDLFLISLKAGGTGLNLIGGDTVILYDSWWNPAIEDQAADRVHRFGQKKAVQVVRMITRGTIEERIHELQDQKRALIDSVVESGDKNLSKLTKEDILNVLEL